jgi:hypothetical protein
MERMDLLVRECSLRKDVSTVVCRPVISCKEWSLFVDGLELLLMWSASAAWMYLYLLYRIRRKGTLMRSHLVFMVRMHKVRIALLRSLVLKAVRLANANVVSREAPILAA